jgi:MFS family permease
VIPFSKPYIVFWRALRWLVRAEPPAPERDPAAVAAEVLRNYRWNFSVNVLEGTAFGFALSFMSARTIVPLFITKLTDSPFPIGVAAVISQAGWFLPQLWTADPVERLPRKKPLVVNLGFFLERLPLWVMVIPALIAVDHGSLALALFLLAYAWFALGGGVVATAWHDLIARCFPVERRGRFWGLTSFLSAGTATAGAALSAWLLDRVAFPGNFAVLFCLAAVFITVSWAFLALTREPEQPGKARVKDSPSFLSQLPSLVANDLNYRNFLVARLLLAVGQMGLGFVTVAAVKRWAVADGVVGIYTAAMSLGQAGATLLLGFLTDRLGHKFSLELGALAFGGAFLLAWLAPVPGWFYLVLALLGVGLGASIVSGVLIVMEFSAPIRRPTYVGLTNTSVGLVSVIAPLAGAWLAELSYDVLFAVSAAASLLAFFMMRYWVSDPRRLLTLEGATPEAGPRRESEPKA